MSKSPEVAQDRISMPYPEPLDERGGVLGVQREPEPTTEGGLGFWCATGTGLFRSRVEVDGIGQAGRSFFR
ncbi:hypothetical protein ACIQI7_12495 [Kitasatospora sp. NPDC092039]|uniref:hypothetical protein n=1 Tax=Kitasatospora sp. NPDC092039 TaxID=3364086 RepID=UPI0037FCE83E